MVETHWEIPKVKKLKRNLLLQVNVLMLLAFVLVSYFFNKMTPSVFISILCVVLWITAANAFYTRITGKPVGTRTSRRVQEFDRHHLGEKRWKRNKIIEIVVVSLISIAVTVLFFTIDIDSTRLDFTTFAFPFIGSWLGYNIGEMIRIKKL